MKKLLVLLLILCFVGLLILCENIANPAVNNQGDGDSLSIETTENMTDPSQGVSEPTQGSTEPSQGSTEPSQGYTEPTQGSSKPTQVPTEPTQRPTEPTTKPTEPTQGPTEPTQGPTEPTQGPTEPDDTQKESAEDQWRKSYNCITIREAYSICDAAGSTKSQRYYLIGTVVSVQDTYYGKMIIRDSTGELLVYGSYGADGKDRPMSLYKDGSAKVFQVLGSKIFYDGAVWQELSLQEV